MAFFQAGIGGLALFSLHNNGYSQHRNNYKTAMTVEGNSGIEGEGLRPVLEGADGEEV